MRRFIIARPNGETEMLINPEVQDFQDAVGGNISSAGLGNTDSCVAFYVNSDALPEYAELNEFATSLAGRPIYGSVVIIAPSLGTNDEALPPFDNSREGFFYSFLMKKIVEKFNQ